MQHQFLQNERKNIPDCALNKIPNYRSLSLTLVMLLSNAELAIGQVIPPDPGKIGRPLPRLDTPMVQPPDIKKDKPVAVGQRADTELKTSIKNIEIHSPILQDNIAHDAGLAVFVGQNKVSGSEIDEAAARIVAICRRQGQMVRTQIDLHDDPAGSVLTATVLLVRVRTVSVDSVGATPVATNRLDTIKKVIEADVRGGGSLDLDRIDNLLMQQLFLGDVSVHVDLVPVDAGLVDLKIQVSQAFEKPLTFAVQYDDSGLRSYGPNRISAALGVPGRMLDGDNLEVAAVTSTGMHYGRLFYEVPVVFLGSRLQFWGSELRYNSAGTHGVARQAGTALTKLLYADSETNLTAGLEYSRRHQSDWLPGEIQSGDKILDSWRLGVTGSRTLPLGQSFSGTAGVRTGHLDLSPLAAAQIQDAAGARTEGRYKTADWGVNWSGPLTQSVPLSFLVSARGQFADKNVDSTEKFILGGRDGVRAFNSIEGRGDSGQILSLETSYQAAPWLKGSVFYDVGWIQRNHTSWTADAIPNNYSLKGWGAGLSVLALGANTRLLWAHQVGSNPGLDALGRDADGQKNSRYHLWLSVSWKR